MQATARIKYLMMSPRKIRRVVSLVKGKSVDEALTILRFTHKAAAEPLIKTIKSATANALAIEGTSRLKAEDLSIARIHVDEGPRAKRIRFRAMGRVYRYKKRFSHLTVVVEGRPRVEEVEKKPRARRKVKTTRQPAGKKKTAARVTATKKTAVRKRATSKKTTAKKTAPKATATGKPTAKKRKAKTGESRKTAAKKTGGKRARKSDTAGEGEK